MTLRQSMSPDVRPPTVAKGIATIEFVMCLPILIFIFVLIFQVGGTMIRQSNVIVEARHEAWQKRGQEASTPWEFSAGNDGAITESASDRWVASRMFAAFPQPQSEHTVTAGSWSSPTIDLNQQPNYSLMMNLARRGPESEFRQRAEDFKRLQESFAKLGELLANFGNIGALLGQLQTAASSQQLGEMASEQLQQAMRQKVNEMLGDFANYQQIEQLIRSIQGEGDQIPAQFEQKQKGQVQLIDRVTAQVTPLKANVSTQQLRPLSEDADELGRVADEEDLSSEAGKNAARQAVARARGNAKAVARSLRSFREDLREVDLKDRDGNDLGVRFIRARQTIIDDLPDERSFEKRVNELADEIAQALASDDSDEARSRMADLREELSATKSAADRTRKQLEDFLSGLKTAKETANSHSTMPQLPKRNL